MQHNLYNNFIKNGYLILPDFVSIYTCHKLIAEQHNILQTYKNTSDIKVIFNTDNQQHAQEKYFFDSARSIKLFYEKDAFDEHGSLITPITQAVNKIGHALHDLNAVFKEFSYNQQLRDLVIALGIAQPKIVQSMYLLKQPKIGNQVDLHQDSTFLYTNPETCIGLWFALEDATIQNGCLWAIPGEHRSSLRERLITEDHATTLKILDHTPFNLSNAVPLEVAAGTLIVLHGRLPHYSEYNHSTVSRHAYSLHVIDDVAEYPASNWLQDNAENPFVVWDEKIKAVL
jgi:phytanoyl-CoA hydroxylase